MIKLSQLFVYPIKSMRGLQFSHAQISANGLAFDRILQLVDAAGIALNAHSYPELIRFTPILTQQGIAITTPDSQQLLIPFTAFMPVSDVVNNEHTSPVRHYIAPPAINQWFSRYLHQPVRLHYRPAKISIAQPLTTHRPILLINDASFDELKQICPAAVQLEQFRPNLVIRSDTAFLEDNWQTIRIGDIIFDLIAPCRRGRLTTLNIETGCFHPQAEPLVTLRQFRTSQTGDIDFGHYLIAHSSGVIRLGDPVEILATRSAKTYFSHPPKTTELATIQPFQQLVIKFGQHHFNGNNQQLLLEQLEQQGIMHPYSCRVGVCGQCRLKLIAGEVTALHPTGQTLMENSHETSILACSCIPKTDIILAQS